jgi:hypothetical protein
MAEPKELPSKEYFDTLLRCDPEKGYLYWKERSAEILESLGIERKQNSYKTWNVKFAGKRALIAVNGRGYYHGAVMGRTMRAHRIIWKMVHGVDAEYIDHIDGDRLNNKIENLRSVSHSMNLRNQKMNAKNTSGHIGVYWHASTKQWAAQIKVKQQTIFLGYNKDINVVIQLRKDAEEKYNFHKNHGRIVD